MTRRATYAAPNGLTAEIVVYVGAIGHTVVCYLDDHDGEPVQRWSESGHTEVGARQLARIYHHRLLHNWNMGLLWHSGTPQAA